MPYVFPSVQWSSAAPESLGGGSFDSYIWLSKNDDWEEAMVAVVTIPLQSLLKMPTGAMRGTRYPMCSPPPLRCLPPLKARPSHPHSNIFPKKRWRVCEVTGMQVTRPG